MRNKSMFRIWRIWHQAKLAKRANDTKKLNNLARQYAKTVKQQEVSHDPA